MIQEKEATKLLEADGWVRKTEHGLEFKKEIKGKRFYARFENGQIYFVVYGDRGIHSKADTTLELIEALEKLK